MVIRKRGPSEESTHPARASYAEVRAVLFEALDHPPEEAERRVLEATAGRPRLREEALALLAETRELTGFLSERPRLQASGVAEASERPDPESLPEEIGGIRIVRALGFGGMGVVYLGEQSQPRRQVAVKVLYRRSSDRSVEERFRREVQILSRLRHPGIARVHEAGVLDGAHGGSAWFSMEYIEGLTLGEYARRNELSSRDLVRLVGRIADIVAYAHDQGILHRDLKPDNVLVDDAGDPHLLDFGVARLVDDEGLSGLHTLTGAVIGTVAYMSPEQARGAPVDERSDVFSLGAMLYELLSGSLPFESRGRSLSQLVRSLSEDEATQLSSHDSDLAGDLESVVHTAIDSDPACRYQDMQAFRDDLARWLEDSPVRARKRTLSYRARKFVKRHRALSATALFVFLALAAALGITLRSLSDSRAASRASTQALADVVGLSHGYSIDDLGAQSEALWPPGPAALPELRGLLGEAEAIVSDIPDARLHLSELRRLQAEGVLSDRYGGELDPRWMLRMQEALVGRMEALPGGVIADLKDRIRYSELVVSELERSDEAWREAAADISRSGRYAGLRLEPQAGLRPLGPDPVSGLHEFAVILPGCTVPSRDEATGVLALEDRSTLVLVLLPGGPVRVGSQAGDDGAPHYEPSRRSHYWPVVDRELLPFMISKYEVTQHQWEVLEGSNPSYWSVGKQLESHTITARHPVEAMTWEEARWFARKLGLELPTEVQLEYAARGGSTGPLWWDGVDSTAGLRVNILASDHSKRDPYRVHAPVGSFPANAYGLHEVLGNVAEMCLDPYKLAPAEHPSRAGDALVLADGGGERTIRGCDHDQSEVITLSFRGDVKEGTRSRRVGLRPIRYLAGLEPEPLAGQR